MGYLVELVLEVHRGMKAEGAVEPLAVVEDFDVFEDVGAGLELTAMDESRLRVIQRLSMAALS